MGIIVILQRIMVVGFEHLTRKQQLDTFDNCIGDNSETTSDQGSLRHIGILYIYIYPAQMNLVVRMLLSTMEHFMEVVSQLDWRN